jgi:hypothetical protein
MAVQGIFQNAVTLEGIMWMHNEMGHTYWYMLYHCMRAVWKVISGVVTSGIEALIIIGNEFLYVCVKEVCRL